MINRRKLYQPGSISGSLIAVILLSLGMVALGVLSVWLYMQYTDQKTNVDGKISLAVATAQKQQADSDEAKFLERDKEPNRQFAGPDDYGRLTFNYPKTWSVYVAQDGSQNGSSYAAYLNPISVPPVSDTQQFALRVTIVQQDYDQVVQGYQDLVKAGKLQSSAVSANGHNGTRLDGSFSDSIRGSAVIYKIRDKTAIIRTDANTFDPDFENIIKTINFNA